MAHTRMQAALPVTVKDKLATWIEPLGRHRQTLSAIRRRLLVIQLGGPVGDRRSFGGKGEEVALTPSPELLRPSASQRPGTPSAMASSNSAA